MTGGTGKNKSVLDIIDRINRIKKMTFINIRKYGCLSDGSIKSRTQALKNPTAHPALLSKIP
jgi:hypothetical protein